VCVARELLRRKIARLVSAQRNAGKEDVFDAAVCHVWVRSEKDALTVVAAADALRASEPEAAENLRRVGMLVCVASDMLAGMF
jgi:hypothetical protein